MAAAAVFAQLRQQAGTDSELAPYVHSPVEVHEAVLDFAGATEGDVIVEIGCGDGRLIKAAALRTSRDCVGYELDPEAFGHAQERLAAAPQPNLRIVLGDAMTADDVDWASVTLVLCCKMRDRLAGPAHIRADLTKTGMRRLWPILREKMAPGSRLISVQFSIDGVQEDERDLTQFVDVRGVTQDFKLWKYVIGGRATSSEGEG